MNEVWDLSILYKDFDDPAFTGDMKALDEAIAAVNTLAGEAAGMEHSQLVHRFLQVQERVEELANKLFIFCSLRCSAPTAVVDAGVADHGDLVGLLAITGAVRLGVVLLLAAGDEGQRHSERQQQCKKSFHGFPPCFL